MADPRKRHVVLTPPSARRIAHAARRVEGSYQRPPDQRAPRPAAGAWNPGVLRAKVTTAIPTGTISSPSITGRGDLYLWDPVGATSSADPARTDVRICNDHTLSASIAVNKVVKVAWIDGDFWVVAADC